MAITFDGSQSASYFKQNPDVATAFQQNSQGMTPNEFAAWHYANFGAKEGRQLPKSFRTMSTTQGQPKGMLGTFNSDTGQTTYSPTPDQTTPVSASQYQRWQREAQNEDMYVNSANWSDYLDVKRKADQQYNDLAKQVLGDDFDAWEAARLGRGYFVRNDGSGLKSYKTADYLQNKFGTADYNAYMQQVGIPTMPNQTGSSTQGYQTYSDYLKTLGQWAQSKNLTPQKGMFNWYERNPNNPTQPNYPTAGRTSLSGSVVPASVPRNTIGRPPVQQSVQQPPQQMAPTGPYPTVSDSSAWKASPTAFTNIQRREGLFK